ncbi:MAG TPA: class I SAM-dependent methyltransferase [Nodosilinea sp.]|nr:class I SAM-dependent methyltransferase [Nodosilinea sp.]
MSENNQAVYARVGVVRHYTQLSQLQPAEAAVLHQLRDRLPTMRVLDIGIGGGRTTQHLLPQVGHYTGIDYCAQMVAACERRFAHLPQPKTLAVMDARDLSAFEDSSFDFILFSFNGIDYVSSCDRSRILQEIHRVGRPGGAVLFSSHNLQYLARAFDPRQQLSLNPLKTYENLVMWGLLRLCNRSITPAQIAAAPHLVIQDESHNFRLQTYYIRPEAQLQQLAFGFDDIAIYPWQRSTQLAAASDPSAADSAWLYYFAVVNSAPKTHPLPVGAAFAKLQ